MSDRELQEKGPQGVAGVSLGHGKGGLSGSNMG